MKKTKPTLVVLLVLCVFNTLIAHEKLHITLEPHTQTSTDGLSTAKYAAPFTTYIYDDGWVGGIDPIGTITSLDIIIVQSGDLVITANTICAEVRIDAGASLTVNTGVSLEVSVILMSSTSISFSSFISNGTILGSPVVSYDRFTEELGTNDLISSPVTSTEIFVDFAVANTLTLADNGFVRAFAPYNTVTGAYENYDVDLNLSTPITLGKGYRAATKISGGGFLRFTGTVETGDVNGIALSDAAAGCAWNLVGNPYPSYIDAASFLSENTSELDPSYIAIYGYDGDASDGWEVLNLSAIQASGDNELIAPGQGFFVKSKSGGGSVDFKATMRRTGTSDDFVVGRSSTSPHYGHIKLNLSSGSSLYSTDFYFNSNASEGLDPGYDASIFGVSPPAFSIYSSLVVDNVEIPLAIQALSNTDMTNVVVPLGVNASQGQELVFSIIESDMSDTTNMYLEDAVNNTVTLLNTSDYIFTPATDLSGTGRFFLRFETSTLSTVDVDVESVKIYANNAAKTITINGQLQNNTVAKLFDTNGRLVLTNVLNTNNTTQSIDVSQISSGVYILELDNTTNERRTEKLIIR